MLRREPNLTSWASSELVSFVCPDVRALSALGGRRRLQAEPVQAERHQQYSSPRGGTKGPGGPGCVPVPWADCCLTCSHEGLPDLSLFAGKG